MLMQMLAGGGESVSRRKTAQRKPRQAPIETDGNAADELALRLEKELAIVLSRRPKHHNKTLTASDLHDSEEPLLLDGAEELYVYANSATSEEASTGDDSVAENPAITKAGANTTASERHERVAAKPAQGETATHSQWVKSTRRSRRTNMFRKTASVAITLTVTTFIISVVAVILFGLPNKLKRNFALQDSAAIVGSTAPSLAIKTKAVQTEPVRSRWVSN